MEEEQRLGSIQLHFRWPIPRRGVSAPLPCNQGAICEVWLSAGQLAADCEGPARRLRSVLTSVLRIRIYVQRCFVGAKKCASNASQLLVERQPSALGALLVGHLGDHIERTRRKRKRLILAREHAGYKSARQAAMSMGWVYPTYAAMRTAFVTSPRRSPSGTRGRSGSRRNTSCSA